jgi:hypothetical protein
MIYTGRKAGSAIRNKVNPDCGFLSSWIDYEDCSLLEDKTCNLYKRSIGCTWTDISILAGYPDSSINRRVELA